MTYTEEQRQGVMKQKEEYQKRKTRNTILRWLLVIFSLWIVLWVYRVLTNIGQPQMEYSEALLLYTSKLFVTGKFSWTLSSTPPFNVAFYTPIGTYILGLFCKVFGFTLVAGRVLNLAYMAGIIGTIYLIVKRETKDNLVSWIAAILPMTAVTMIAWSFIIRIDLLAVLFEIIGIYFALRYKDNFKILWSIPFFLLAFYTKQNMLAGAVAVFFYLWFAKLKWTATLFAGVYGTLLVGIFAAASILTNNGFFKEIILYQRTSPALQNPITATITVLSVLAIYLPIVVMAAVWLNKRTLKSLLGIYAISALVINAFTYYHIGGGFNYMEETIVALSILSGLWIAQADFNKDKTQAVLIATVIFSVCLFYLSVSGNMGSYYPGESSAAETATAEKIISDATYPILTENFGIVFFAGKEPYYDSFVFDNMAHTGQFDESIVLNDLTSHRIEYVITTKLLGGSSDSTTRFDDSITAVVLANYHIIYEATDGGGNENQKNGTQFNFIIYKVNGG